MDERTEQPPTQEARYRSCGQDGCTRGWLVGQGRPCSCWAEWLGRTVPALLAKHAAGPR